MAARQDTGATGRLDYAIVGAGVSGLYTAWRLLKDAKKRGKRLPSIRVYEASDRTGGRLLTWLPAGKKGGLRAELGGMRFYKKQRLVWKLIEQLGFGRDRLTAFWVDGPNRRQLLRGVSIPADDPNPTARYDLPANLGGQSPDEIIGCTIEAVLKSAENWPVIESRLGGRLVNGLPKDRRAWDMIKPHLKWRDTPLWDVGFWNLLSDVHSPETYQYLVDALGYFSLTGNWNAAEAMECIALDFTVEKYMSLDTGYSTLPNALASQVRRAGRKAGYRPIELNTRLVSFEAPEGGPTTLQLARGDGRRLVVEADNLVLAMPRRSLELLAPSDDFDIQADTGLRRLIQSVKPQPAFKLYLFYDERWWERLGIIHGRSVSDLPIRQTYYFAPQPWRGKRKGAVPKFGMLLASYNDARAVEYWEGLAAPKDQRRGETAELRAALEAMVQDSSLAGNPTNIVVDPPPHLHLATPKMLRHAREQLALLHDVPVSEIPEARVGGFGNWARDPFGGGWDHWESQVHVKKAMKRIKKPLDGRNVFVVGDAYSGAQGWVEGALTATEVTLQRHLGLARPKWLPKGYYLGW